MSKIVCVASGKGGVGKTTSVVNLGSALNRFGFDTIVVDGNINTPDLGLHLGMPNNGNTLNDVLSNSKSIYESVYLHPNGTKVVPADINMWGVIKLNKNNLDEIKKLKSFCDVMLLDCSPGLNNETENCIRVSDEVLIITNPEVPSVTDALKTVMLAKKLGKPVIGAIINKKLSKNYEMSDSNIQEFLGVPILSAVPDDERVKKSLHDKKAVVDEYPFSKASIGFKQAAAKIIGQEYEDLESTGLISRLFGLLRK